MRTALAFTLVEVLVAVAMAAVIASTAYVALRVTAQAATTARRLADENALLRAGVDAAIEDLDTWRSLDDPVDPAKQPLRVPGNPFAPVDFASTVDRGLDFSVSDPRCWWRGALFAMTDRRCGDYARFSHLGSPDPVAAWYPTLLDTLHDRLGGYATIDYMPVDAVFSLYDASGNVPSYLTQGQQGHFYSGWQWSGLARGYVALLHGSGHVVTADPAWLARDVHRSVFQDNVGAWDTALLTPETFGTALPVLPLHPATMPALSVKTLHWFCYGWPRADNAASITLTSPVTGEITRLTLWLTTTTLRGARRMRGLDGVDPP